MIQKKLYPYSHVINKWPHHRPKYKNYRSWVPSWALNTPGFSQAWAYEGGNFGKITAQPFRTVSYKYPPAQLRTVINSEHRNLDTGTPYVKIEVSLLLIRLFPAQGGRDFLVSSAFSIIPVMVSDLIIQGAFLGSKYREHLSCREESSAGILDDRHHGSSFFASLFSRCSLRNRHLGLFYQTRSLRSQPLIQIALEVPKRQAFPKELDQIFLILIPKVENSQGITQLRLIGLCNGL